MRNLNECQAEVFRRSEKRIKERKQRRKHILMACIPLVLCITVFSAFILPAMMPTGFSDKSTQENGNGLYSGGTEAEAEEITGLFAGAVNVNGNGISHSYTSVEEVQQIMGLINGIVAVPETNDQDGKDFVTNESTSDSDDANNDKGYTIIITRSDGISTEYYLLGNVLIDQTTKEEFVLEEKVYFELKDALGIPQH